MVKIYGTERGAALPVPAKMLGWVCAMVIGWAASGAATAAGVLDRVRAKETVRVCIWPDYFGVSHRNPNTQQLEGVDIDLSVELGKDLKAKVQYVDSSFATLVDDVTAERCDVAMFAVGMLPQRLQHLKFSRPYMQSDIYAITTKSNRTVRQWSDIDQPGVLVGVQGGTFMEPVMKAKLTQAEMLVIKPPQTRERELEAGRIDVFMTDFPYSRRLLSNADWAKLIAPPTPFSVLPYGYAVKPGDEAWLAVIDGFVARIKKDGRLRTAATRHGLLPIVVND
ncbi:MAG: amino acid ABC transporter substrate-binding protein [Curvibacter sp. RIFCSPHIGHO2_12_FULL_63_18]|nr:MAG: amino acid ABC transporter substrate-binding protein [Curvibacter sp. GWA2_63_95]OGP05781.1 MAG: amino acid ABC transporter substrate-binding protein [Curvibacter sp. RIFCSPHIGHO2_12_FULL_63_18]HCX81574.1 amino acid ABC transporter substrate-binding protein [Rhodoferax sp.]